MANPPVQQERDPKTDQVWGAVTTKERAEILAALDFIGTPSMSKGTRAVMLAFSRVPEVREKVAAFLRENLDILAA